MTTATTTTLQPTHPNNAFCEVMVFTLHAYYSTFIRPAAAAATAAAVATAQSHVRSGGNRPRKRTSRRRKSLCACAVRRGRRTLFTRSCFRPATSYRILYNTNTRSLFYFLSRFFHYLFRFLTIFFFIILQRVIRKCDMGRTKDKTFSDKRILFGKRKFPFFFFYEKYFSQGLCC